MSRLHIVIAVGLLAPILLPASPLTEGISRSKRYDDLIPNLKQHGYEIQTPEEVPDKLFDIILKNKATDADWRALQHYREIVDAGASLAFMRSCVNALKKDATLFYRRYMTGDPSGLARMRDALSYDFSAYSHSSGESYGSMKTFYEDVLTTVKKCRHLLTGKALKRHDEFALVTRRQFKIWQSRYEKRNRQSAWWR